MPDTFIKIASVTVGAGGASNIAFNSIPSTYTDLCVKYSLRGDFTAFDRVDLKLLFNSSTASWTDMYLLSTGSSVLSNSNGWAGAAGYPGQINTAITTSNTFSSVEIYIPNYAGSNYKSISVDSVEENNATAARAFLVGGLWSNTAAITSITISPNSDNFVQYSTATLYGISKS